MVEWNVDISLISDSELAYTEGDNSSIVATDTMKNTVYVMAKRSTGRLSMENFAVNLGKHFVETYAVVTGCKVSIVEQPWERVVIEGQPHSHGFKQGKERHTTEVEVNKMGSATVVSGIQDLALLKTTQSGFEGYIRDEYTILPETRERIVASNVSVTWRYGSKPECYSSTFSLVKDLVVSTFFGPPDSGVYSPSVQKTLHEIAEAILSKVPEVKTVFLNMPNLHFIPVNMPLIGVKFDNDVYLPTSEPHGTIEAHLTRKLTNQLKSRL